MSCSRSVCCATQVYLEVMYIRDIRMELTNRDNARAAQYRECKPKQFGTLHERMKYVMELLRVSDKKTPVMNDLREAIFDLETEVSFYEPKKPPYGKRIIRTR